MMCNLIVCTMVLKVHFPLEKDHLHLKKKKKRGKSQNVWYFHLGHAKEGSMVLKGTLNQVLKTKNVSVYKLDTIRFYTHTNHNYNLYNFSCSMVFDSNSYLFWSKFKGKFYVFALLDHVCILMPSFSSYFIFNQY